MADVERWPQWNPSVTGAQWLDGGQLAVGSRARIKQPRLAPAVWQVTNVEPGRSFDWVSRGPGWTTRATHRVQPGDDVHSQVHLSIEQTGPLSWLIGALLGRLVRRYVQMETNGLRQAAEAAS